MSEHTWVLENLAAHLTGGLESAERERLEQHTAECAACAAALADARDMDAALEGLFAGAQAGPVLEDRVIQSLRVRTQENGLRLPMPGWLAIAAAALLLVGFSGALANYLIVQGGLPIPGTKRSDLHGLSQIGLATSGSQDVDQLAQSWRERVVGFLDQLSGSPRRGDLGGEQRPNELGFYPPAEGLTVKGSATIHQKGSNFVASSDDESPPGGHPPARMPPAPGNPAAPAGETSSSYPYNPGSAKTPLAKEDGKGNDPKGDRHHDYFKPGQLTDGNNGEGRPKGEGPGKSEGKDSGTPAPPGENKHPPKGPDQGKEKEGEKPPDKPKEQPGPRKIVIRSGDVEFEVESFDAAVATITRLVKSLKGGFVATVNSDKLANGKVRGSVVVRVPPENLDQLILDLRTNLGKTAELKNQRISSQDITKQYTDLESRLRAARTMEERLLQIIKAGKGEIKDLLAAEKELGVWRTRIEEIEGELRYYGNLVALSTLTITLYEKEIQAPFGVVETERVNMGIESDDVDQALQSAQKAVRDAKGRITKSELKQHSAGQFSATLNFEVSPDASGPMRDRLRQLGTVARLDIDRLEETQGGTGKPYDGKTKRSDSRFFVSFYNLINVAPRETVHVNLACVDAEGSFKKLLARVEKAGGRVVSSNLNSARSDQTQGDIRFEVKSAEADAVLVDVKSAGEVMQLNVTENADIQNTTRKKRGFHVQLWALGAVAPRETNVVQIASTDVAAGYRALQEAVAKVKGRMLNAQLNEQDRQNITAVLDFEVRRSEEAALRAALGAAGDIYTRKVDRAQDSDKVIDSKVRWQLTLINQAKIPPRETFVFGIEVGDVDQTAAMLSALVGERQGRTVESNLARERSGRVTGKLIYDVPLAKVHELIDRLKSAGNVRVQQSSKHPEVPDSALAVARLDVTLSNVELLVPSDEGFWPNIRRGLSTSFTALSWSLTVVIVGLCVVLPWALVIWAIVKLVARMRRKATPPVPAA